MATRKQPAATVEDIDPAGTTQPGPGWGVAVNGNDPDDDDGAAETLASRVRAAFSMNPDANAYLRLWRVNPKDKKLGWCDDYSVQEFNDGFLGEVRSKWGPGKYEVRLYGSPDETSTKRHVLVREQFTIEGFGLPGTATQVPAPPSESASRTELLLERLLDKMSTPPAPPPDPLASMNNVLALMEGMRKAMGPPPAAAPATNPLEGLAESLKLLGIVKQGARDVLDDTPPPKEESLMAVAMPLIQQVLGAMNAQQQQPQAQPVGPLVPVQLPASIEGAAPAPQPETQPPEAVPDMNLQLMILGGAVARLVALAKTATPESAEEAAQFIANDLPEEYLPLLDHEHDGKRWPLLTQAIPAPLLALLAPHQAWVETVLTRGAVLLDEADAEGGEGGAT